MLGEVTMTLRSKSISDYRVLFSVILLFRVQEDFEVGDKIC